VWVNRFTRSKDESISGMVVGVVRSACRVDVSRLDSKRGTFLVIICPVVGVLGRRSVPSFKGVYVISGPVWNLVHNSPCVESLVPPWLLKAG
jgi:hypothetical protein